MKDSEERSSWRKRKVIDMYFPAGYLKQRPKDDGLEVWDRTVKGIYERKVTPSQNS